MIPGLHADHVDTSGAYGQKFEVVKDLLEKGVLKEIPEEFSDKGNTSEEVPVITTSQTVVGDEQSGWNMSRDHADHVDETGRYAQAYMERFGSDSLNNNEISQGTTEQQQDTGNSWKSFLKKIIAEEKSKLKV
jgi:hypothetical protein